MIWKINTLLALALAITISVPVIEAAQAADSTETAEVSAESFVEIARVFPKSSKSGLVPLEKVLARIVERMEGHSHVVLVLGAKPTEASHFQFSELKDPWVIYLTEPLNTFAAQEEVIEVYANQMEEGNFIVGDFNSLPFLREISATLSSCFDLIVTDAEVGKFMSFTHEHFSCFLNMLKNNSSAKMVLDYYVGDHGGARHPESKTTIYGKATPEALEKAASELLKSDKAFYRDSSNPLLKHDRGTKRIIHSSTYQEIPGPSLKAFDQIYMDYFNTWKSYHLPAINLWWVRNKLYPYWRRDLEDKESISRYKSFGIAYPSNFLVMKKGNPVNAATNIQAVARGRQDRKALAKRLPEIEARLHKNSARISKEVAELESKTTTRLSLIKAEEALLEKRLAKIRTEKDNLEQALATAKRKEDYVKAGLLSAQSKVVAVVTEDLSNLEKDDGGVLDQAAKQSAAKSAALRASLQRGSEDILEGFATDEARVRQALGRHVVLAAGQDPAQFFIEDIIKRLDLNDDIQWKSDWAQGLMRALVNMLKNNTLHREINTIPLLTKELQSQTWDRIKGAMEVAGVRMAVLDKLLKYDSEKIRKELTNILGYDSSQTDSEKFIKIFLDGLNSIQSLGMIEGGGVDAELVEAL